MSENAKEKVRNAKIIGKKYDEYKKKVCTRERSLHSTIKQKLTPFKIIESRFSTKEEQKIKSLTNDCKLFS